MSLPGRLDEVVAEFVDTPDEMRLEVLLEYGQRVAPLPPALAADRGRLEQVVECQTPFFLELEVDGDGRALVHFDCPPEAPTVRGFAGILSVGLDGAPIAELADIPRDLGAQLHLTRLISPLRLRGLDGIIHRLRRRATELAQLS